MPVIYILTYLASAAQFLIEEELQCIEGTIRCVIETRTGHIFNVPNFCITDPVFEKNYEALEKEKVTETQLNVKSLL